MVGETQQGVCSDIDCADENRDTNAVPESPRKPEKMPQSQVPHDMMDTLGDLETFRMLQAFENSLSEHQGESATQPCANPVLNAHFQEERFKKLKLAYLELESKARFLDVLLSSNQTFSCPADDSFRELELQVAHSKTKLKKVKQTRANQRSALCDQIARLAETSEGAMTIGAEVAGMQRQLDAVLAAKKIQDMAQATTDETKQTISTTDAEFMMLVGKLDCLRGALVQRDLNALVAKQTEQNHASEEELESLKSRKNALEAREAQLREQIAQYKTILEQDAPIEAERVKLHDRETELDVTRQLLEKLSSISNLQFGDELMSVTIHANNVFHVLEMMFEPGTTCIQAALLTPQPIMSVSELTKTYRADPIMFVQKVIEQLQH